MLKRQACLLAIVFMALPITAALAQDDNRWEHHREHCEALEHEEHELREHRDRTPDPVEREHIEHRLHEIEADRDMHCRR